MLLPTQPAITCSKLTIKTPERRQWRHCSNVSIVNFKQANDGWRISIQLSRMTLFAYIVIRFWKSTQFWLCCIEKVYLEITRHFMLEKTWYCGMIVQTINKIGIFLSAAKLKASEFFFVLSNLLAAKPLFNQYWKQNHKTF